MSAPLSCVLGQMSLLAVKKKCLYVVSVALHVVTCVFMALWLLKAALCVPSVQHLCSSSLEGESDNAQPIHHLKLGLQIMEITSEKMLARHYL